MSWKRYDNFQGLKPERYLYPIVKQKVDRLIQLYYDINLLDLKKNCTYSQINNLGIF
jgi:hypothetical protein